MVKRLLIFCVLGILFLGTIYSQESRGPDFLIIGSQKCGTTSLFSYLKKHPLILTSQKKELHFFNDNYEKGVDWYKAQFPNKLNDQILIGEATPGYLYCPYTPERVAKLLPNAKLIVLLRNPVDRAWSHYKHYKRKSMDKQLNFEQAINYEIEEVKNKKSKKLKSSKYKGSYYRSSYVKRGIYVNQLKHWMIFFPKKQFIILKSEDFFADPDKVLSEVLAFLELPECHNKNYKIHNKGTSEKIDPTTRMQLVNFFRPYNTELEEFLGVKFDWD